MPVCWANTPPGPLLSHSNTVWLCHVHQPFNTAYGVFIECHLSVAAVGGVERVLLAHNVERFKLGIAG